MTDPKAGSQVPSKVVSEPTTPPEPAANGSSPKKASKNQFGTFSGVFTPTILTILGVIMFMRANFVIGEAGVLLAIVILLLAKSITLLTSLSISAISTNIPVKGGGSYFLISRVLGREFGGAIGISLFLATALSTPFYIIGFIEALRLTFEPVTPWALPISLVTAAVLFVVAFVGAQWAIKVQYFIMGTMLLALIVFMGGAIQHFSWETLSHNWLADYSPMQHAAGGMTTGRMAGNVPYYSFWLLFAIYFPAVTGIDAGLNMSGDLKDPATSIPRGTLVAIGVGMAVYLVQIVLSGGAFERELLQEQPFRVLVDNALFGLGFLVTLGVFAATLSSALGSMLGAPRVLQALARDHILGILTPFAKGSAQGDEPQRALVFSGILTAGVLIWAFMSPGGDALNIVAAMIAMLFLYTYGMINLAAFMEAFGRNPSFRPRFRLFHWISALIGGIGCVLAAFLINTLAAAGAAVLIAVLILYLRQQKGGKALGNVQRGFVYTSARNNLIRLAELDEDARNWRPTMLVFSGNPNNRPALVTFAEWLSSDRGIVFFSDILVGDINALQNRRLAALKRMRDFCKQHRLAAFPIVVVEESVERGVATLLQTSGSGMVSPNLAVFGWCDNEDELPAFFRQLRQANALGISIILIKADEVPHPRRRNLIHVWWRGKANGHLMMILGHLLQDNPEWDRSQIEVLRGIEDDLGREPAINNLGQLIEDSRIDAQPRVVVSTDSFVKTLASVSAQADCVFLGFQVPDDDREAEWYAHFSELLAEIPSTILVNSTIREDLLS